MIASLSAVVAVSNEDVLHANALASPIFETVNIPSVLQRGYLSASLSYNEGMAKVKTDIVIFVHQDVYIPKNWLGYLEKALDWLGDKPWAVLGIIGKTKVGRVVGRTWSTGIGKEVGCHLQEPVIVESLDELICVVNRKSGIMFDENLPGFHLYGTDIVQIAKKAGYDSYVFEGPVIHNSLPILKLDKYFYQGYAYLQKKWHESLPIKTLVTTITRYGWPLKKSMISQIFQNDNRNIYRRLDDPAEKSKELGYEK